MYNLQIGLINSQGQVIKYRHLQRLPNLRVRDTVARNYEFL
jgi:hypothetical protein